MIKYSKSTLEVDQSRKLKSVGGKVLNILLRSLAVTFSKSKKRLYPAIALVNPFSCFANQVHSFRIFSTSSIYHVEKQHRTLTSCFHKSNTKFRWCNNHKSNTNDRPTKKWVHSFTQTNWKYKYEVDTHQWHLIISTRLIITSRIRTLPMHWIVTIFISFWFWRWSRGFKLLCITH